MTRNRDEIVIDVRAHGYVNDGPLPSTSDDADIEAMVDGLLRAEAAEKRMGYQLNRRPHKNVRRKCLTTRERRDMSRAKFLDEYGSGDS